MWLYDPVFGDSDDEHMHLNDALGEDMDDVEGDCPYEAGTIYHLKYFCYLLYFFICIYLVYLLYFYAAWLDKCDSKMLYKWRMQSQVLYVVPVTSILGRLALVPVGDTGTTPFRKHK